jgi:hypothetical protein
MQYINVTIELLRRFSSSKRMKELLAVAIWMKMQHSNSVIWNVSVSRLKNGLHIGKDKSRRLIQDMRGNDLFAMTGDKVMVSSFRDRTIKRTRKGWVYHGAMVCKFEVKDYTLRELYNLINEKLFEFQICAAEHKDCSLKDKKSSSAKGHAITTKQFGKAINMSIGSVSTIKKRLVGRGRISSTYAEKYSFDVRNKDEKERVLHRTGKKKADYTIGELGFIVLPCSYSIEDRRVSDGFRHLIYGKQKNKALQRDLNARGIPDGFYC